MMNQSSAVQPDNSFNREDINVNRDYTEEYNSTNMYFESFNDNDDEVFEEFQETSTTVMITTREPRIRRVSDVIDSIGCSPSSPVNKSGNFDFNEKVVTEVEESISTFRREEKYINLMSPPKGKALGSASDCFGSPPTTPSSDLGYCSAGVPTPPSNLVFRPKWFRYSASSCEASSPPKLDALDAQVMCVPKEEQQKQPITSSPTTEDGGVFSVVYPKASMPVTKHSIEYNMNHPKTGHAVIFNHEEFKSDDTPTRVGSKLDANRLAQTLSALGFSVQIYNDLDSEKINLRINELASLDHTECDCVFVAVLSHGMGTSYILSHDYPYPVDMLWSPFTPDRCPTLAGKPKLFIIQACRGEKLDGGVHLVKRTQVDSDSGLSYKIPAMADFLLAYSTAEGFYSWRNPQKGTWFIQSLCEVLENEAFAEDLQTLLLMVAQKVALDYESYSDLCPWQHQQKQVPQTVSTLIRKVRFRQKQ